MLAIPDSMPQTAGLYTRERKIYDYGSIRLRYAAKTPDTAREAQASYERH